MKKVVLGIIVIILIGMFCFGVKSLLDLYSEENKEKEESDEGWEIEAEYTYNGTLSANELQIMEE